MAKVAVIVGSLRRDSWTRKVARALVELAPDSMQSHFVETRDLAVYDADLDDAGPPAPRTEFRRAVLGMDGVLFVTPEYNPSVPGGLKNAIDVGSRLTGKSAWRGKPAGIVSVSPGKLGACGANHHLRQSLVFLDMPTLQQPEMYLGGAAELFDAEGRMTNEGTREFLRKFMIAFASWVELHIARPA